MSIVSTVVGKANKFATWITPHLPTIGVVVGTTAICVGGFITGRATLTVDTILQDHKESVNRTRREVNELSEEIYSEAKRKEDLVKCYALTAGRLFRHFAPGITLCGFGFLCVFKSFGTVKRWHALALSAATSIDNKFAEYRGNVIEELGEEADQRFMMSEEEKAVEKKEITIQRETTDEDGNEVVEDCEVMSVNVLLEDDFTRVFNWQSKRWENSGYVFNDNTIHSVISTYTKFLQAHTRDHVFMNTLFRAFGVRESGVGHLYGYTDKPGCAIDIDVTPYVEIPGDEGDDGMPTYILLETGHDYENHDWYFVNKEDEKWFKEQYIKDETKVGFLLHFNVDTDENGIPKNIFDDVYGTHLLKA